MEIFILWSFLEILVSTRIGRRFLEKKQKFGRDAFRESVLSSSEFHSLKSNSEKENLDIRKVISSPRSDIHLYDLIIASIVKNNQPTLVPD